VKQTRASALELFTLARISRARGAEIDLRLCRDAPTICDLHDVAACAAANAAKLDPEGDTVA